MIKRLKDFWHQSFHSRIARRFVLYTVLCSTTLALLITAIQLYNDYRTDLSTLDEYLQSIEASRVPSLVESMWNIDERLIETQLQGILQLEGVEYVAAINQDTTIAFGNSQNFRTKVHYTYPLEKQESGRQFMLGELQITVSLDHIYTKLMTRGIIVLLSNTVKTCLVAMFIILIYRVMIGQHISHIASFIRSYKAENVDTRLSLARHFTGEDELSYLQTAINQWIESQEIQLKKEQQANIKLNRANEELSQFSYSASHDLKAPLTSIVGFLRFAKQDTQQGDNEKALYGIERAMEEAERLSERIEDMLTLAKSELANNEWETVDIASLIEPIWLHMQNAYNDRPAKITTLFTHQHAPTTVKVRLQLIIENLLSNALKYANPEKEFAEIIVQTQGNADEFTLSVRDNGIGIPEAYHDKVFMVFQRFANSSKPSSGLGLAIVKKNVEQLGGNITFTSSPEGTTFTIALPQDTLENTI